MGIWKQTVRFYIGGAGYMFLEFAWRGRSHGSMFLLGGLCFLLIGQLSRKWQKLPLAVQLLLYALIITALELTTGLIFNRDHAIWDYRSRHDYLGQICLEYSLLWIPVSLVARTLYRIIPLPEGNSPAPRHPE